MIAKEMILADEGLPLVKASAGSTVTDYDFLIGTHDVEHRKLVHRLVGSNDWISVQGTKHTRKILGDKGNIEEHFLGETEAIALRLFDPATRLWSLYWADSIVAQLDPPLKGSFDGDMGVFFGKDRFNGQEVWVQFQYDRAVPDAPVWGQAFSIDGEEWEWNWFMYFKKRKIQ